MDLLIKATLCKGKRKVRIQQSDFQRGCLVKAGREAWPQCNRKQIIE